MITHIARRAFSFDPARASRNTGIMKLAQLTEKIASDLGERFGNVRLKTRLGREAGKLSSGKRGPAGADVITPDVTWSLYAQLTRGETSGVVAEVEELESTPFSLCEWVDMELLHGRTSRRTDDKVLGSYKHTGACLPPGFEGLQAPVTASEALSRLLSLAAKPKSLIKIRHLECRSDEDGLTIEFQYSDMLERRLVVSRYVEQSGDSSDGMMFAEIVYPDPSQWDFTLSFTRYGMQRSRKEQMQRIPGEIIARIAREALGGQS